LGHVYFELAQYLTCSLLLWNGWKALLVNRQFPTCYLGITPTRK
jgi:hypothetical protein